MSFVWWNYNLPPAFLDNRCILLREHISSQIVAQVISNLNSLKPAQFSDVREFLSYSQFWSVDSRPARRIHGILQSVPATIAAHVAVALNPLFDPRMTVAQDVLFSSDIPTDPPLDVQSGDPPTTPADVPQASTTTTQQEPPSSLTVPSPSVPQPTSHRHRTYLPDHNRSGAITTLISTFADIDRRIRTHGHSEINKGLERLLTCTQCYLVGVKGSVAGKEKEMVNIVRVKSLLNMGVLQKVLKSLCGNLSLSSSGVAPFAHIPSDTPPLIITASDIIESAKKQASLSHGGLSGIPSDVWRSVLMDKASAETFAFMSTYFVSNPSVLPNFLSSKVFALRKSRSTDILSTQSYRTIAMAELPLRILHRAILAKIGTPCHPCQYGDGVPDCALKAAYHVLLCIALCDQTQKPIRILQIDSSNAFNTLSKNSIMESLRRKNVNSTLQNYISFFLSNQPRFVVNKDGSLTHIVSPRGAPQGDCLSMKLYNVSVDDIIQEVCCNFDSISVEIDGHSLTLPPVVFYADDMTLMTQSDNITEIFDFVRSRLRARLLDVKPSKCLFFSNREDDSTPMIDDTPITRVDSLYFLGYLLTR
ncbi:hypothetical protein ADUPG1_012432, partial [Aduncisulcus paluster]